ncbi:MAG: hypothetical protein ACOYB1_16545 [Limnohabitans sp.]
MPMNTNYLNAIAAAGRTTVTHIGLVDGSGNEITGASYARQAVTWTTASNGQIRPSANLVFQINQGTTVAGWRGFSAATAGTNFGGSDLTSVTFTNSGTYTLLAASTAINHNAA